MIYQKASRMRKIWVSRMIVSLLWLQALADYSAIGSAIEHIPNLHQVEPWFYRGGRPQPDGLTKLFSMNIKTIVSLERGWFEREPDTVKREREFAVEHNITFIHIPMHPFFRPEREDILKTLNVIMDPANQPVFVHCRRGSDRTGIVVAAFRIQYQGWTSGQAQNEMEQHGFRYISLFWWRSILDQYHPLTGGFGKTSMESVNSKLKVDKDYTNEQEGSWVS
jgi:protein tyrosine/serine phosphatase